MPDIEKMFHLYFQEHRGEDIPELKINRLLMKTLKEDLEYSRMRVDKADKEFERLKAMEENEAESKQNRLLRLLNQGKLILIDRNLL